MRRVIKIELEVDITPAIEEDERGSVSVVRVVADGVELQQVASRFESIWTIIQVGDTSVDINAGDL